MIKDLFFPRQLNNYFLFGNIVVGIDITPEVVHVTKVLAKGESRTILFSFSQNIEDDLIKTLSERTVVALKKALERVGKYDEVISSISSSGIIFKELEVPFADPEKISQIVAFEMEPLLPFSINHAVINFIVTETDSKKSSSSTIMVAATPYAIIEKHLALLALAGVNPEVVTIDVFALYGLLLTLNFDTKYTKYVVVDIEKNSTTLSFFDTKQLRLIRTLSYGFETFLDRIAKKDDLSFTIKSVFEGQKDVQLLFLSRTEDITVLCDAIATQTGFNYELISYKPQKEVYLKGTVFVTQHQMISLANALPNTYTQRFNLRQKEFAIKKYRLFFYQSLMAALLLSITFIMLLWHYSAQVSKLRQEINSSEQEVISLLKEKFNIPEENDTFDEVVEYANDEAAKNRDTWLAFSNQARSSFLQYLLELVSIIDKKALGFEVSRISMEQDRLILQAKVRDYEALKILERELRESPLFSYIEPQDSPDFTMAITLAPLGENV